MNHEYFPCEMCSQLKKMQLDVEVSTPASDTHTCNEPRFADVHFGYHLQTCNLQTVNSQTCNLKGPTYKSL